MRIGPSAIRGAGLGVFAAVDLHEGQMLGKISGTILFQSSLCEKATAFALQLGSDRVILLRFRSGWAVVDTAGATVFEFVNCSKGLSGENVHVSETGVVTCERDICVGTELLWWYGGLHAAAHAR